MKILVPFLTILLLLLLLSDSIIDFVEGVKLRNRDEPKKKKKKGSSGSSVGTTPPADHPKPTPPKPKKKKKPTSTTSATGDPVKFKPGKPKYVEIVDLALDVAKQYCTTLGPLIQRRRYSWKRRCDVYYEAVEMFILGFSDTMINEFDLTQQEMAKRAQKTMKLVELKSALKGVARRALESAKTTEKQLQAHLNARLSQWIMNIAIGKENSNSNSFGGGFAGMGPASDGLTEDDRRWAEEVSADDYEDDPQKDDPDYIHKMKNGGGDGGMPSMNDASGNPMPQHEVEKLMAGMKREEAKRRELDNEESEDV